VVLSLYGCHAIERRGVIPETEIEVEAIPQEQSEEGQGEESAKDIQALPQVIPEQYQLEMIRYKNREYVCDRLGALAEDPWFDDAPQEEVFLYFTAVSGKAASEQLARTRAREEARRLIREYSKAVYGEELEPTVGKGIEPFRWKIITGVTKERKPYYIACLMARVEKMIENR
jgi:hypothetical protein